MLLPHQHQDRLRSVGRATPNNVITVVDEQGIDRPSGRLQAAAEDLIPIATIVYQDTSGFRDITSQQRRTRDAASRDAHPARMLCVIGRPH
jgi:hypothetical protein